MFENKRARKEMSAEQTSSSVKVEQEKDERDQKTRSSCTPLLSLSAFAVPCSATFCSVGLEVETRVVTCDSQLSHRKR